MMNTELPVPTAAKKNIRFVLPPEKGPDEHQNHADNYWTLRNRLIRFSIAISALSIIFSALSLFLAILALNRGLENQRSSIENQRDMKSVDLLVSFQKRYDDLAYDVRSRVDSKGKALEYYHRFWDLQFEQYQYWKSGWIKREIYSSWMDFRQKEFDQNDPVGGISFQDGWTLTERDYLLPALQQRAAAYKDFTDFMDKVLHGDSSQYRNGPPPIK